MHFVWGKAGFLSRFMSALALTSAASFIPTASQARPGCDIVVFKDEGFSGQRLELHDNVKAFGLPWNDKIASIRVLSGSWEFFRNADYQGDVLRHGPGDYPFLGRDWIEQISSLRCVTASPAGNGPSGPPGGGNGMPNGYGPDVFIEGGQSYGWVEQGWNGPGYYIRGYEFRPGRGFGGRDGFHGHFHLKGDRRGPSGGQGAGGHGNGPGAGGHGNGQGAGGHGNGQGAGGHGNGQGAGGHGNGQNAGSQGGGQGSSGKHGTGHHGQGANSSGQGGSGSSHGAGHHGSGHNGKGSGGTGHHNGGHHGQGSGGSGHGSGSGHGGSGHGGGHGGSGHGGGHGGGGHGGGHGGGGHGGGKGKSGGSTHGGGKSKSGGNNKGHKPHH